MIRHEIKYDLQSHSVGSGKEKIEVLHSPKHRIYPTVVGNVVAKIRHRRGENWRKPQGANT